MFKRYLLIVALILSTRSQSQTALDITEIVSFPNLTQEEVSTALIKKGWSNFNFEVKSDSNFNRRTWITENVYSNMKSYVIHYEYSTDPAENYLIYQFSDRPAFKKYAVSLKEKGYKKQTAKQKGKKNKKDKNIHKEISEIYYSEKDNSVLILKDVFFYGMNTFMIYSYKYASAIGKNFLNDK